MLPMWYMGSLYHLYHFSQLQMNYESSQKVKASFYQNPYYFQFIKLVPANSNCFQFNFKPNSWLYTVLLSVWHPQAWERRKKRENGILLTKYTKEMSCIGDRGILFWKIGWVLAFGNTVFMLVQRSLRSRGRFCHNTLRFKDLGGYLCPTLNSLRAGATTCSLCSFPPASFPPPRRGA